MSLKGHSLQKRKQTKIVGANNRKILLRYSIYSVFILIGIPKGIMILNDKEGEKMAKKKNKQLNNNKNALPKVDVEFAEESGNGLEKVALKAQKRQQNK